MAKPRRRNDPPPASARTPRAAKFSPTRLRIVAGTLGGRKIRYNGDPATRPMKERTRESVFSLLGGDLSGTLALDLFAGTGILAFEAISRGAEKAVILEMSRPAVSTLLENLKLLDLNDRVEVHNVDTLRWLRGFDRQASGWPELPWIIFCCPPYRMWTQQTPRLAEGLLNLYQASPPGSVLVCETEETFDLPAVLPQLEWDVRKYRPAHIALARKESP